MLIVHGTAEVSAEDFVALQPVAARMVAASNAEEGCVSYVFARDLVDPKLLRITEVWVDQAALDLHFGMPHMAEFQTAIRGKVKIIAVNKYHAGEPLPLR